jgi:hypothetical protein
VKILTLLAAAMLALTVSAGTVHAKAWMVACKGGYSRVCYVLGWGVAAVVMSDHLDWPAVLVIGPGLERSVQIDDNPPIYLEEGRPGERVRKEPYRTIEAQMRTGRTMLLGAKQRIPLTGFGEALDDARRQLGAYPS